MISPKKSELDISADGPATYVNRFVASGTQAGVRLSFMESGSDPDSSKFRSAVLMSYQDAIELKNLLADIVKQIEDQIKSLETNKLS